MKKILFVSLMFLQLLFFRGAFAASDIVEVEFFYSKTCPHCHEEIEFFHELKKEISNFEVDYHEITDSENNYKLLQAYQKKLDIKNSGVPLTIVGEKYFVGFQSAETTGELIREAIIGNEHKGNERTSVKLPFVGSVDYSSLSLPVLTVVLGGLDGFNPCAMWVLVFLISLLLGMKDRKRMWILGGAFILSSAFVYFLFMVAWLNLFLFIGMIFWVRIAIAIVALASGGYYLYDYFSNPEGTCKVSDAKGAQKIFERLRNAVGKKSFVLALVGVIVLAAAVNLVELVCSAGLPAVFTQVLTLSDLPTWKYYLYVFFYITIFMLDDMIVFSIAMLTLNSVGISGKYSKISRILGGILMLILGLLLAFKPGWLMF
jgi:thiol-disulfide isomerase/thioredoxin